jgi:multiple sugar transport system ATP-binding protein
MAFGLKLRRLPRAEIRKRVEEAAQTLGLEQLLERKPKALSGGQRQRVALGRAIVRQPKVFLFDEPLSNLDAKMRIQMRSEIIKLHQRLQATIIYVTHDQVEAMTMGDVIVVMDAVTNPETGLKEGVVQQVDTPFNLYEKPANKFVAGFLGSPPMNFFRGRIEAGPGGAVFHETDGKATAFFPGKTTHLPDILLGVRPEGIHFLAPGADAPGSFEAPVDIVEYMGSENYLYANSGTLTFLCRDNTRAAADSAGSRRRFLIDPAATHLFDPSTGLRVEF